MRLKNKKALIVGASSGVGLEAAKLFVEEGSEVTLVARSRERLQPILAELGPLAHAIVADVGEADECKTIVPGAVAAMGGLDLVVYTAGLCQPCSVKDMSIEAFKAHLDVNLTGNFIVAQAAALHMNEREGGAIINFSSELSHIGMAYYVHYCAAKAGVVGLTRAFAAEFAPKVRVNSISPGPVDTPMLEAELAWFGGTPQVREGAIDRVPLKRFATSAEIARAALFLAAEAPFATGSTWRLDGGTTVV